MTRGWTVVLILLGIMVVAVTIGIVLHNYTDLKEITIAIIVLTLCSSVADTLSVYRYVTKKE